MEKLHDAKNEDYAEEGNPFSNFEGVAAMTGLMVDQVFQVIIGIKMMRLRELLGEAVTPNFESTDDTIMDLAVYAAIWKAWRLKQGSPVTIDGVTIDWSQLQLKMSGSGVAHHPSIDPARAEITD